MPKRFAAALLSLLMILTIPVCVAAQPAPGDFMDIGAL